MLALSNVSAGASRPLESPRALRYQGASPSRQVQASQEPVAIKPFIYPPPGPLARFCLWLIEGVYQGLTGKPDEGKHGTVYCWFKDDRFDQGKHQSNYSCSQYCAESIRKYGAIPGVTRFILHRNIFCQPLGGVILKRFPALRDAAINP